MSKIIYDTLKQKPGIGRIINEFDLRRTIQHSEAHYNPGTKIEEVISQIEGMGMIIYIGNRWNMAHYAVIDTEYEKPSEKAIEHVKSFGSIVKNPK